MTQTIYETMVAETTFAIADKSRAAREAGQQWAPILLKADDVFMGVLKPWETGLGVWA